MEAGRVCGEVVEVGGRVVPEKEALRRATA